jgi:glycosidase/fibronectin type 3 domain-containing protein
VKLRGAAVALVATVLFVVSAAAAPTPPPASVTIAGSLQSEAGCPGDWDAACAATHLAYDANDDVWQGTFTLPSGSYEYKATLNDSWAENYGLHATRDGANVPLSLGSAGAVKFFYDHETNWVTDNRGSTIVSAPGSFQSELGCSGDWDPGCLRSWLQDADLDGVYTLETTGLPAGDYEAKAALNESWDENYGAGGVRNGPNIPFRVSANGAKVTFSYTASTHVLTVAEAGNVEWDGLRHDSRDTLYRAPGGAVPAGTPVLLRFRTFHEDVTGVAARIWSANDNAQRVVSMKRVAADVSCFQVSLSPRTCDYWQVKLDDKAPDLLWYRFIVTDGSDVDYYADDSPALDGGPGAASDDVVDQSYALTVYDPAFATPAWARDAVVYQIFPDRFRNGNAKNDPRTGDVRYDDPALKLPWNTLPEGYCRNYADANGTTCPWRFDTTPPDWSPVKEGPRGRDYMGGDLDGVRHELNYLRSLGINTIYFNPIFASRSNHGYDTASYREVNPYFGNLKDWRALVAEAKAKGIRIVLDGVFNHMSSDSPLFDRYHHYADVGACESLSSPWRTWFVFRNDHVPCGASDYEGWFGFDSIPTLQKSNPDVQQEFVAGKNSISRLWLGRGAAGWRLDVMGDSSFPDGYWETFRKSVKAEDPNALIVGELWPKDTTTLRYLRGDRADSTMNYRLRDAIIGLLAPHSFDGKGLGGGGRQLSASEFAARLQSIQEDYAPQAFDVLMNLVDSHDTERALWTLTPGAETRADRERNAANLADGKRRLRLAALIQFTLPGMPTVYYGDEVGVTGDDDPDDRRTYPWSDTGGSPDESLRSWYSSLASLRRDVPALTGGDLRVLYAADGVVAYGRKSAAQAALVVVNTTGSAQTVQIPLAGYLPAGTAFTPRVGAGTYAGGQVTIGAQSAEVFVSQPGVDLQPPAPPSGLVAEEGNKQVSLHWNAVDGAASYDVYRSPVTGGGYVLAGTASGTSFVDTGLRNAQVAYYVVRALDPAGNASDPSAEVSALPHLTIGWANLQWPPSMTHTVSAVDRTGDAYGQVWIDGATNQQGATPSLRAQLGFGPDGSTPSESWTWVEAAFNGDSGNNDEFVASMQPEATGSYDYMYRYTTTDGREWTYADLNGLLTAPPHHPGDLTVTSSGDKTAPATPTGLHLVSASPNGVELAWNAVGGDPSLYGYEVLRGGVQIARITGTDFVDRDVVEGQTYRYAVRAVDKSFNRSPASGEVEATAALRHVDVTFSVTVPASTPPNATVYIAGTLNRLDPAGPEWNPGGQALTKVDATHWRVTLRGLEATQLEYKYTLGDWDHVEKDAVCGEISNRQLTLSYGPGGAQTAADTVANWRNVAPCGN